MLLFYIITQAAKKSNSFQIVNKALKKDFSFQALDKADFLWYYVEHIIITGGRKMMLSSCSEKLRDILGLFIISIIVINNDAVLRCA